MNLSYATPFRLSQQLRALPLVHRHQHHSITMQNIITTTITLSIYLYHGAYTPSLAVYSLSVRRSRTREGHTVRWFDVFTSDVSIIADIPELHDTIKLLFENIEIVSKDTKYKFQELGYRGVYMLALAMGQIAAEIEPPAKEILTKLWSDSIKCYDIGYVSRESSESAQIVTSIVKAIWRCFMDHLRVYSEAWGHELFLRTVWEELCHIRDGLLNYAHKRYFGTLEGEKWKREMEYRRQKDKEEGGKRQEKQSKEVRGQQEKKRNDRIKRCLKDKSMATEDERLRQEMMIEQDRKRREKTREVQILQEQQLFEDKKRQHCQKERNLHEIDGLLQEQQSHEDKERQHYQKLRKDHEIHGWLEDQQFHEDKERQRHQNERRHLMMDDSKDLGYQEEAGRTFPPPTTRDLRRGGEAVELYSGQSTRRQIPDRRCNCECVPSRLKRPSLRVYIAVVTSCLA
ncbi:hypothetical protein FPQ18DRAFT_380609 [Pyronema domesticum]|nr:hypothetical protein FPQ18DRAFT_380609 [Pyronema domesticum]